MIPIPGINPHGLETTTVKFHFIQKLGQNLPADETVVSEEVVVDPADGSVSYTTPMPFSSEQTRYCWLSIPKRVRDEYGEEWSTEMPLDSDHWDSLVKYRSKKMEELEPVAEYDEETNSWQTVLPDEYWGYPGDPDRPLLMLDNTGYGSIQHLYTFQYLNYSIPEYAAVYVVDTSGSMKEESAANGQHDYTSVKNNITSMMWEYFQNGMSEIQAENRTARAWLYSGTWVDNVKGARLGTLDTFEQGTVRDIQNVVSPKVNKITKRKTSEAMITCFYYALADIQNQILKPMMTGGANGGYSVDFIGGRFRALTFVLQTDESIFTGDSLNGVGKLKSKFTWYNKWQAGKGKRFPTTLPAANNTAQKTFLGSINSALKHMSRYYGVNITIVLTTNLSAKDKGISSITNSWPFLNSPAPSTTNNTVSYTDKGGHSTSKQWDKPSNYHVDSPQESMYRIVLRTPSSITMNSDRILTYEDQFSLTTFNNMFHKLGLTESGMEYCAFGFKGDDIILPNLTDFSGFSEENYRYYWKRGNEKIPITTYTTIKITLGDQNQFIKNNWLHPNNYFEFAVEPK